jgi:hypothetical protein
MLVLEICGTFLSPYQSITILINQVLTQDGITQIAHHKYKGGSYTSLDQLINPIWNGLTNLLPMWLAPNMITTLGGAFCLMSYLITCHYNFHLSPDVDVPDWILIFNGLCMVLYYTLDW